MAHIHITRAKAEVEVPLEYQCAKCGLQMDVMVHGAGMAGAVWDTEDLEDRAHTWAMKSAFMRCALWPCPNCGARDYADWRRGWIRMARMVLLAMIATAVIWWIKDQHAFGSYERDETFIILAGIFVFFELVVAGAMLYELRAAKKAVRPLANVGTDST
ncbi:MAG TPA: hypothetical protein VN903_35090 [Polyangia bacterium]|nr:hypothetical protein [Polyangia bacterium]